MQFTKHLAGQSIGHRCWTLGSLYAQTGQRDRAIACYRSALYAFRQVKDAEHVGYMLSRLGDLLVQGGEETEARSVCVAAVRLLNQLGLQGGAIAPLQTLALIHFRQARPRLALRLLEKALGYCEAAGDSFSEATVLTTMAQIYTDQRQYLFALACHEAALEIFLDIDAFDQVDEATYCAALSLCQIGRIAQITHHPDHAIQRYLEALDLFTALDHTAQALRVLDQLVQLHEQQGSVGLALHYRQQILRHQPESVDMRF